MERVNTKDGSPRVDNSSSSSGLPPARATIRSTSVGPSPGFVARRRGGQHPCRAPPIEGRRDRGRVRAPVPTRILGRRTGSRRSARGGRRAAAGPPPSRDRSTGDRPRTAGRAQRPSTLPATVASSPSRLVPIARRSARSGESRSVAKPPPSWSSRPDDPAAVRTSVVLPIPASPTMAIERSSPIAAASVASSASRPTSSFVPSAINASCALRETGARPIATRDGPRRRSGPAVPVSRSRRPPAAASPVASPARWPPSSDSCREAAWPWPAVDPPSAATARGLRLPRRATGLRPQAEELPYFAIDRRDMATSPPRGDPRLRAVGGRRRGDR